MSPGQAATPGVRSFRPGDEPSILAVVDAALPVDDLPGITRNDLVQATDRLAGDPEGTLVALEGDRIVGYCTPRHDDLTIDPAFRRLGHGRRLVAASLDLCRSRGLDHLILYGPADREPAAAFIEALGFAYHSSLWQFLLPPSVAVELPALPADVVVRPYHHEPGARADDLAAYVALATATFADHPTPLTFSEPLVAHVHGLADFDASRILLVAPRDAPARFVAWTKVEQEVDEGGGRKGYISFIGVLPAWRGRGLGRELLRWGIANLRAAGVGWIELNVEAANDRALGLYRRTGFEPGVEWPHYSLSTR